MSARIKIIRSPVAAGIFYPEDRNEILEYLKIFHLKSGRGGFAQAIIAPHGAWNLSGEVAANAFFSAMGRKNNITKVVILGPIHDKREEGIFLSNSHYFNTPLGNIPVDQELSEEFEYYSKFLKMDDIPHLSEHSIEILLPFIKYCFPHASIVPILMGQYKHEYINDLSCTLRSVITPILDETLLVVSCNLSCDGDLTMAKKLAEESLNLFYEKDTASLCAAILSGRINPCGGALVLSLLQSGLLDGKYSCKPYDHLVSAEGIERKTVFYSTISFE